MRFRTVALITAIATLALGAGYLFAGALVVGRWRLEPTEGVLLLGRRIGALYLGLAVIFSAARSAAASAARTALCAGAAVATSLLAILGACEFAAGRAGPGILPSAALEAFLVAGFISVLFSERKERAGSPGATHASP